MNNPLRQRYDAWKETEMASAARELYIDIIARIQPTPDVGAAMILQYLLETGVVDQKNDDELTIKEILVEERIQIIEFVKRM
jgi:hypothetical protein